MGIALGIMEQASRHEILIRIVTAFGNWLDVLKSCTESGKLFFAVMTLVFVSFKDLNSILFDVVEIEFALGINGRCLFLLHPRYCLPAQRDFLR